MVREKKSWYMKVGSVLGSVLRNGKKEADMTPGSRLVIGLGNPGENYRNTRHNIGFMVIDSVADEFGFSLKKKNLTLCTKRVR